MEIALMLEGQNGLTWPRWQAIAALAEAKGFAGLYRSDHFTNGRPPDLDSLECWTSLTWLASQPGKIEFGPLVSPFSFRHPAMLARFAAAIDLLSGGRLRIGVGAGWQHREHEHYSFDLLSMKGRMDRMEEGLIVLTHLLRSDEPLTYSGKYYQMESAVLLPRPGSPGGVPVVVGGNGEKRTLPVAAKYADEWNGVFLTPAAFQEKNELLGRYIEQEGRQQKEVRRTLMTGALFDLTVAGVDQRLEQRGVDRDRLASRGIIFGAGDEFLDQVAAFEAAGVERLMLQWLDLDDLDRLEAMADLVLPVFHTA